jgi:hypothetical protein
MGATSRVSKFDNLFLVLKDRRKAGKRADVTITKDAHDWLAIHEPVVYHLLRCRWRLCHGYTSLAHRLGDDPSPSNAAAIVFGANRGATLLPYPNTRRYR